jgi:DNA-binding IclR family transcriptional regulator
MKSSARKTEMHQAPAAKSQGFLAVGRILFELCDKPELGVLDLARRAGVSTGMAQRITAALVESNLLAWDPHSHKYSLGEGVLRLSGAYTRNTTQDMRRCLAELERLAKVTGETAALHRRVGHHRIILAQVESPQNLSWRGEIGRLYPLHAGAAGKALLAFMPDAELDALLEDYVFEIYQPTTPKNRRRLTADLAEIRGKGVAVSYSERDSGAGGVAAPVFDAFSRCAYSLSIYGPENRVRPVEKDLIRVVRAAATRASNGEYPVEVKEHAAKRRS